MILFTILTIIAIALLMFTVLTIAVGGMAFIVVFADVIVCVCIIVWLLKRLTGRKKK